MFVRRWSLRTGQSIRRAVGPNIELSRYTVRAAVHSAVNTALPVQALQLFSFRPEFSVLSGLISETGATGLVTARPRALCRGSGSSLAHSYCSIKILMLSIKILIRLPPAFSVIITLINCIFSAEQCTEAKRREQN